MVGMYVCMLLSGFKPAKSASKGKDTKDYIHTGEQMYLYDCVLSCNASSRGGRSQESNGWLLPASDHHSRLGQICFRGYMEVTATRGTSPGTDSIPIVIVHPPLFLMLFTHHMLVKYLLHLSLCLQQKRYDRNVDYSNKKIKGKVTLLEQPEHTIQVSV